MSTKAAILGSGAMGCLFGGMLAEAGCDVVLIDIWRGHSNAVNDSGLKIDGPEGNRIIRNIRSVTNPVDAGSVDLVMVFVKGTLTEQVMREALCLVEDDTTVLTLQSGLGNVEKLCGIVGASRVVAGTTEHGADFVGPGHICHSSTGETLIGSPNASDNNDPGERVKSLAALFKGAKLKTRISTNVVGMIWTKQIVNAGLGTLSAVTGLKNGRLLDFPETTELLKAALEEARAVAEAKGIRFEGGDLWKQTIHTVRQTAASRSAMLQDVTGKRPTEVSVISGVIVEEGKKLGIPTPVSAVLTNLILTREKTYKEM
jgi:2-dehydropantoate 2-reductase